MRSSLENLYFKKYQNKSPRLCKETMLAFLEQTIETLFPELAKKSISNKDELNDIFNQLKEKLNTILTCIAKELSYKECQNSKEVIIEDFFNALIQIEENLTKDANYILKEDPAAKSLSEVIICYPGFYATATYRIAHFFYQKNIPLLPRILSEFAHSKTGIDIHPGAKIKAPFYIDHGTGIVIGETTEIGSFCKIYQGVTLGALSVAKNLEGVKRHPTIEEHCLIYANATILGGNTVLGKNSIIGGNVWLTESIPSQSQVFRKQGFHITRKGKNEK